WVVAGLDQVRCALPEPGRRRGERVQEREAVERQPARRNQVTWKGLTRERIDEDARAVVKPVVRIQELAEITAAHLLGRHRRGVGVHLEKVDPFLRAEKEQSVLE